MHPSMLRLVLKPRIDFLLIVAAISTEVTMNSSTRRGFFCALLLAHAVPAHALKIIKFLPAGGGVMDEKQGRIGAVLNDREFVDFKAAQSFLGSDIKGIPLSMDEFIAGGDESVKAGKKVVDAVSGGKREAAMAAKAIINLTEVVLLAPITSDANLTFMGGNYGKHVKEMGGGGGEGQPKTPIIFFGVNRKTVIGAGQDVIVPAYVTKPDWEAELGVVIGKAGRNISEDKALDHVAGYTIVNDVTDRAMQMEHGGQWFIGKNIETFKVIGPYFVTKDEIPDPQKLDIRLWVSGVKRQEDNTSSMTNDIRSTIAFMSKLWTIQPGEVLATGTMHGVGHAMKPPVYLKSGDKMKIEITGLGMQESNVVFESQVSH